MVDFSTVEPIHDGYKDLRVGAFLADEAACGNFRIIFPLWALKRGGASVSIHTGFSSNIIADNDFIIAQRQHSVEVYDLLKRAKWSGRHIIFELDDNVHTIHPTSPVFDSYRPGSEVLHNMEAIIGLCDGFFTTSVELAGFYSKYNKKTWVLPNFIDFGLRDWDTPAVRSEKLQDKIVIGWAGSITHQDDATVMGESLKRVLDKYPQTVFAVCSAYQTMSIFCRDLKIPEDRVVRIEPVAFDAYPNITSNFDINLIPVVPTTFNKNKSDLKIKEAGAWGVPYVASNLPAYLRFHLETNGQGGYLVNGVSDWEDKMAQLVEDEEDRRTKGGWLKNYIRTECSIDGNVYRWANALRELRDLSVYNPQAERKIATPAKVGRNDPCPLHPQRKYKKCSCYGAFGT